MPNPVLGELPESWEATTLGEVCDRGGGNIQTGPFGSQLHASDYVPVGIPSIMPVNIGQNRLIEDDIKRITEEDAERLSKHRVLPGDIIYSRRGDVERRALVREEQRGWLCGTGCMKVRLGEGVVDPAFTSFYLDHPQVRGWIVQHAVGATMPNLNTSIMRAIPFALPPMNEQRAIASVLGSLDAKIELNRRMNETLESLARAIFKSWFVDFDPVRAKMDGRQPTGMDEATAALFPDSFEHVNGMAYPTGWKLRPVSESIEINPKRRLSKGQLAPYLDMKSMPTNGHHPGDWVEREFNSGARFVNGDTLLARITPCLENGKTAFVDFLGVGEIGWGSTEYIVLRSRPPLPLGFAYYLARSDEFRAHAINNMTGSSGRQRVPTDCFDQFLFPVPSNEIADTFGRVIASTLSRVKANCEESRTLAALRDTLLPKLLSGELRVGDAMKQIGDMMSPRASEPVEAEA